MSKIQIDPRVIIYPQPVILVGTTVNNKPNFMVVAACGMANNDPPMISISLRHTKYTLVGLRQYMTFSVNIPSIELIKETDYCGTVSGSKVDKAEICKFKISYGKLNHAPLIEHCPVNLECTVMHILNLGSNVLVLGKVEATHIAEHCLTDGKPDVDKVKAFAYIGQPTSQYRAIGEIIGKPSSIGRDLEVK
jgi:flavin reductase (DIM6/NTAB) family NADH-FMN oxidoreductase RutF